MPGSARTRAARCVRCDPGDRAIHVGFDLLRVEPERFAALGHFGGGNEGEHAAGSYKLLRHVQAASGEVIVRVGDIRRANF